MVLAGARHGAAGTIPAMQVHSPSASFPFLRRSAGPSGLALCMLLLGAGATWSAPAPWYYWRSKIDGQRVCAQVSPGQGWERDSTAYDGPGCRPRTKVFVIPSTTSR